MRGSGCWGGEEVHFFSRVSLNLGRKDHMSSLLSSGPKGATAHDFLRAIEDTEYLLTLTRTRVLRRLHPNSNVSVLNASTYAQIVV